MRSRLGRIDNGGAMTSSAVVNITVNSGVAQVYYIVPDHLNTPRFVADGNGTTVWRWDQQEPFGATPPNDDPDGDGVKFDFPLRFPGQYADRETNLNYNYFRDYDPAIGRYVKSDPIGLGGGMDMYGYVWQSPLMFFDTFGLECWWLDLGYAEKCDPTGLRRQKPTQANQSKEWFPAPDPTSPSLTIAPIPPMPEPGWKIVWRTVFKETGYWEAEFECKVSATYVCRDACGKITFNPGNMPLGKKWKRESDSEYEEIIGYGPWSNVNPPTGPYDLDVGGGGRPGPRPSPRPAR